MLENQDDVKTQNDALHEKLEAENELVLNKLRGLLDKESEDYIEVSGQLETFTDALSKFQPIVNQAPTELVTGSHVLATILSLWAVLRAAERYISGEPFTLPQGGTLLYAGAMLILLMVAWFLPALGAILALTSAALGFGYAAFQVGKYFYNRISLELKERHLDSELSKLEFEYKQDECQLQTMSTSGLDVEVIGVQLNELKMRHENRVHRVAELIQLKKKCLEERKALEGVVLSHAYGVLTSSLLLAGAIGVFLFPYVGGFFLLAGFVLGCAGLLYKLGTWAVSRWYESGAKQQTTPLDSPPREQDDTMRQEKTLENASLHRLDESDPLEAPAAPTEEMRPLSFEHHLGGSVDKKEETEGEGEKDQESESSVLGKH